jgi:protein-tyrosine-phosphatase
MEVLFICKYNAGRSRMAEAIFNKLSKKNNAISRGIGSNPHAHTAPRGVAASVKVLSEWNIKMQNKLGKSLTKKDAEKADIIVVLLDKKQRHILPKYISNSPKTRYYGIVDSDAREKDFMDQHRRNRDIAKRIVSKLVKEIG